MKKLFLVTVAVLLFFSFKVYADEVSDLELQLEAKKAEIVAVESEMENLQNTKTTLKDSVLSIDEQLKSIQEELDKLYVQITAVSEELRVAQEKEDVKKSIFQKRLVALYEKGNLAYVEVLFQSKDIMEISKRREYFKQISEYDWKIFEEYLSAKKEVEKRKNELDKISSQYQQQKDEFDLQLNQANSEIAAIDETLKEKGEVLKTLNSEKREIDNKLFKHTYAGKLLAEGEKYLGYPYVWGGSSPETSFDCSGFVCWTYTHSGVYNLPRCTAQLIYNQCEKISPSEARAGDLIFFQGTYNSYEPVTHVGIYAGDNRMLHCGDPIKYASTQSPYWQSHFYAYGRLVK